MTRIFAHRGASAAAGDNTREAFELAVRMGADGVELDVRRTADGLLAVHHDPCTADGRPIAEIDSPDLPDRVLLLGPALDACGPLAVNVEIKNSPTETGFCDAVDLATQVCDELVRRGTDDRWILSSFDLPTIAVVAERYPGLRTALLCETITDDDVEQAVAAGFDAINPGDDSLTRPTFERVRQAGLEIWPWTIDDESRLSELISWGVDGLFTNHPDRALRVRDDWDRRQNP